MRVRAISFEGGGFDLEGLLRLQGLTVLFGRNGTGKTRALEAAAGILDPDAQPDRSVRIGEPTWSYGRVFVELEDVANQGEDWSWFTTTILDHDSDSALEVDWFGVPELVGSEGSIDDDPEIIAADGGASHGGTGAERVSWEAFYERAHADLIARFAEVTLTYLDTEIPAQIMATVVAHSVLDQHLIAVQNHEAGTLGVAWDPTCPDCEVARSFASALAGTEQSTLATRLLERIAEPGDQPREIASLAINPANDFRTHQLAEVVWIPAEPWDAGADVDGAVDRALAGAEWLDQSGDSLVIADLVPSTMTAIAADANGSAPEFVRAVGEIQIAVDDPRRWSNGTPRSVVAFRLSTGEQVDVRALGAGTRRWVNAAVSEAARRHRPRVKPDRPDRRARQHRVILVDEPELHLHPTAQVEIGKWLRSLCADGDVVLAASHSPEILNQADHPVGLVRAANTPVLVPLAQDLLGAVDDLAGSLGMERGDWLRFARAILVVEGQHDLMVLRRFYDPVLRERRIPILAIRGTRNAEALVDSDFLGQMGLQLFVMFDSVRASVLDGAESRDLSSEERKLVRLQQHFDHQLASGHAVHTVPYADPDIICALPLAAVARAFPESTLRNWDDVVQGWMAAGRPAFKAFALTSIGLRKVSPDDFVSRVLAVTTDQEEPSTALQAAVSQVLADVG